MKNTAFCDLRLVLPPSDWKEKGKKMAVSAADVLENARVYTSVEEAIAARGIPYYALSDATAFLPEAYRAFHPGEAIAKAIEDEFRTHGVKPLKLT